ncbi:hypothetical protein EJB05_26389, partial [Eragrostis curvula]
MPQRRPLPRRRGAHRPYAALLPLRRWPASTGCLWIRSPSMPHRRTQHLSLRCFLFVLCRCLKS